jgi:hypothetical protein
VCIPHNRFAREHGKCLSKERTTAPNKTDLGRRKGKPDPTSTLTRSQLSRRFRVLPTDAFTPFELPFTLEARQALSVMGQANAWGVRRSISGCQAQHVRNLRNTSPLARLQLRKPPGK